MNVISNENCKSWQNKARFYVKHLSVDLIGPWVDLSDAFTWKPVKSLRGGATKQTSTTNGQDSLFATDGDPLTYSKTAISIGNSYSQVSADSGLNRTFL